MDETRMCFCGKKAIEGTDDCYPDSNSDEYMAHVDRIEENNRKMMLKMREARLNRPRVAPRPHCKECGGQLRNGRCPDCNDEY